MTTSLRRWILRRRLVLVCLVLLAGEAALVVSLAADSETGRPHSVPVAVVAPGVVAQTLADQMNALQGRPFAAVAVTETEGARTRDRVADGSIVAALLVDLSRTEDTLVVNAGRDPALNDAVVRRVRETEATRDRTLVVTYDGSDPAGADPATLSLAAAVLGLLMVVIVSLRNGPVALTLRRGVRRVGLLAALSVAGGAILVLALGGPGPGRASLVIALVALHVLVVSTLTLALEALAGIAGLAVASLAFLVVNAPLLTRIDAYLLPQPWSWLATWAPSGAALESVSGATALGGHVARPTLVLLAWFVSAVLTLLLSRWVRAVFGGRPGPHRDGEGDVADAVPGAGGHASWVLAAVVPAAGVLLSATLLVPDEAPDFGALPSLASETECIATGQLRSVKDLNRVTGWLRGSPAFQGGDVGADVLLQDGRRLWLFGDTLRGDDFDGQTFVRNSMLVVGDDCLSVVVPADHGALIPDRPPPSGEPGESAVGYWPMSVGRVERPGYDLLSVAAQRVRTVGEGVFGFENLGTSIAVFVVPAGKTPQLVAQRDIGRDNPDSTQPTWGAASTVVEENGPWVYLYGTSRPDATDIFGFALTVARVRPDDILEAGRWRYWDGAAWSTDDRHAAILIPAQGGVSQTLSVFEDDGTWYALSKQDEFLGTNLTVWTAPAPTGPFTLQAPLRQLPSDTATGLLRYMPLAHPELLPRDGTMVVSYSRNTTDFGKVVEDPLLYRPRFLRVTLP